MKLDRPTITLVGLIAGYVILAIFELREALDGFKPALFADGLHNILEIGFLGANLWEHRRTRQKLPHSHIPNVTALVIALAAVGAAIAGLAINSKSANSGEAAMLAGISLGFAVLGTWLTHGWARTDINFASVLQHLQIDVTTSGAAVAAYVLLLLGAPSIIDPLLTVAVAVIAIVLYRQYANHHAHI